MRWPTRTETRWLARLLWQGVGLVGVTWLWMLEVYLR